MRKLLLSLVFVLATGSTLMNANSNDEVLPTTKESIEILEDFGCARDCVDSAMNETFEEAAADCEEPSISDYLEAYEYCYYSNC